MVARSANGASVMSVDWPSALIGAVISALGALGTIVMGLLVHRRDSRRIDNEGKKTEAGILAEQWDRLVGEVGRLDERVKHMEAELVACHAHKSELELELAKMRLAMIERGNVRQTAQLVSSTIAAEMREQGVHFGQKPQSAPAPTPEK